MPKIIELTVEIDIQKVSCPGVWLCQGGRVCLTVFALGTSYQTCLLPPVFPLMFKDVFYFKKRFQESCALSNICCLLKDETIYCELLQCGAKCITEDCMVLAQYLGAMNDVLFPPNMCSNDGVDLLMRRSKIFPGILSPKIEIATKVRIDEVWDQPPCFVDPDLKTLDCECSGNNDNGVRQKQVCHSAGYHRVKCNPRKTTSSRSSSCSRPRSAGSSSANNVKKKADYCGCTNKPVPCPLPRRHNSCADRAPLCRTYCGYALQTSTRDPSPMSRSDYDDLSDDNVSRSTNDVLDAAAETRNSNDDQSYKVTLESRYIHHDNCRKSAKCKPMMYYRAKTAPCVCEICRRYHELFHTDQTGTKHSIN